MEYKNGNGNSRWLLWMAGILFTILFTGFTSLTNAVIGNDKDSRGRDEKINDRLQTSMTEQRMVSQKILIALKEVQTDLKYLKRATPN